MAKRSKRFQQVLEVVDRAVEYAPREAIELAKKTATAGFDETMEVHMKLGVDPRHADQQVRGTVVLPHGTGKDVVVAVFAKGEKGDEARKAGADFVGAEDLAERIQEEGWTDFDVAVATPDMMSIVGRLGRILGPRGLMPNPKAGTVTFDITDAVREIKAGKVEFRVDKQSGIHVPFGKASFEVDQLVENFRALMEAILRARPPAARGAYLRRVAVSTTMGPGIKVNPSEIVNLVAERS